MRLRLVTSFADKVASYAHRRVLERVASASSSRSITRLKEFPHERAATLGSALDLLRRSEAVSTTTRTARIEEERARLQRDNRLLSSLGPTGLWDEGQTVSDACRASRRPKDALMLHQLVRAVAPRRAIELGTNVGISSAYIAAAQQEAGGGATVTLEVSAARSNVAQELHRRVGLRDVEYVVGLFQSTLSTALSEPVDFAFIDGHHQRRATLDYFDQIWRRSTDGAVVVFDDIRWTRGMSAAWKVLRGDPRLAIVVDLCGMGVGVVTKKPAASRHVTPIIAV